MIPDPSADSYYPFLQETYDTLPSNPNPQFQAFDYPSQAFTTHPQQAAATTFPSPPTPPGQNIYGSPLQQVQHPQSHHRQNGSVGQKIDGSFDDHTGMRGGSEEDENMTPAQSRRKAQNRAAYVLTFPSFHHSIAC